MKEINLTKGYKTVVDDIDFEWLSEFKWYACLDGDNKYVSVRSNHKGTVLFMSRLILSAYSKDIHVDHINRDPLDNRRCNLRLCTLQQNRCNVGVNRLNTSGYKGVNYYKITRKWAARIGAKGKRRHIGYFNTAEEAAQAYDKEALEVHGDFAFLNFPILKDAHAK